MVPGLACCWCPWQLKKKPKTQYTLSIRTKSKEGSTYLLTEAKYFGQILNYRQSIITQIYSIASALLCRRQLSWQNMWTWWFQYMCSNNKTKTSSLDHFQWDILLTRQELYCELKDFTDNILFICRFYKQHLVHLSKIFIDSLQKLPHFSFSRQY